LKKTIKYLNFFFFIVSLYVVISLQSYTHFSTLLFSVLEDDNTKKLMQAFQQTKSSHTLLVAVKGFDNAALKKMQKIEKELDTLTSVSLKRAYVNDDLQAHQKTYKLFIQDVNVTKLSTLDISKELNKIYNDMTTSFFPVMIDKVDPFTILISKKPRKVQISNGHLTIANYGYISYFSLDSKKLEEHQEVYNNIHRVLSSQADIQFFSSLFYYVENSQAIRSDVEDIAYIAFAILILLYLVILKDVFLLTNTFITLATSAILATLMLTQMYEQISIFVFVFGISISTVAIDYMFHHYLHEHYSEKKRLNKEVLFGFLTTFFAFFILSFTSFLLIKQIAFFTMTSLLISYIHFAFLYPLIGFQKVDVEKKKRKKVFCAWSPKLVLFISVLLILISSVWVHFDFNMKNLDYDNQALKKKEHFFKSQHSSKQDISFVIKGNTIDALINHSKKIQSEIPTTQVSLSGLMSKATYAYNKDIFMHHAQVKEKLEKEAKKLGFKEAYFYDAYKVDKPFIHYSKTQIKQFGIDMIKIDDIYITFGIVKKKYYEKVLKYNFVRSISVKEHFEVSMKKSVYTLGLLGTLVIIFIMVILLLITKSRFIYAVVFLLFPIAMMGVYAFFFSINILHLFMLFIVLAIGIDYAIYMVTDNDIRTKKAIGYSLVSTFAGFGVLVFSHMNALFSLGVIALIGIVAISMLLLCMKKEG